VLLTYRELLCLPSAALTALLDHETTHARAATAATLTDFDATSTALEQTRGMHEHALSPALHHPAHRAKLRALCEAEAARQTAAAAAAVTTVHRLRKEVPEHAVLAEQRLEVAVRQVGCLVSGVLLPDDLVAAEEEDAGLGGPPPLNMLQLERWGLALKDVEVDSSGEGGRPFGQISVALEVARLSQIDLGWSAELASMMGTAAQAGEVEVGLKEPTVAQDLRVMALVDMPPARALIRAHRAATHELGRRTREDFMGGLQCVRAAVHTAEEWQSTWAAMLAELQPSPLLATEATNTP
jgi:hypothetical protein